MGDRFGPDCTADVGLQGPPRKQFREAYEERDYLRGRLAAVYCIFGQLGLNEGFTGHITLPSTEGPKMYGMASDLPPAQILIDGVRKIRSIITTIPPPPDLRILHDPMSGAVAGLVP